MRQTLLNRMTFNFQLILHVCLGTIKIIETVLFRFQFIGILVLVASLDFWSRFFFFFLMFVEVYVRTAYNMLSILNASSLASFRITDLKLKK